MVLYVAVLLIYTSGSSKSFEAVAAPVKEALASSELQQVDMQGFRRNYQLNPADFDGVMMYASEFRLAADEVLLIRVKSQQQITGVVRVIEERLQSRRQDFDGYVPEQVQLIDQAQLSVRGNYIFLAVGPDAEHYKKIFSNSL